MNNTLRVYIRSSLVVILACLLVSGMGIAGEYPALDGLNDVKAVFDVRGKNVKPITLQLDLIHKTFHDINIRNVSKQPDMVVVFGGGAVKLVSSNREGYSEDERTLLDLLSSKLNEMARDGIRLEICEFAADVHDVDLATVPENIHRVDNGWISIIGYQAHGYSLVAVF